jgi:hypothetical protein
MCLVNQTSMTNCLTGVLVTIGTPAHTDCAKSAEVTVPDSGCSTRSPLLYQIVDDCLCSALAFPKLKSTAHASGTTEVLGNAMLTMWIRIRQVLHAVVGRARAPWRILFVQVAWPWSSYAFALIFAICSVSIQMHGALQLESATRNLQMAVCFSYVFVCSCYLVLPCGICFDFQPKNTSHDIQHLFLLAMTFNKYKIQTNQDHQQHDRQ